MKDHDVTWLAMRRHVPSRHEFPGVKEHTVERQSPRIGLVAASKRQRTGYARASEQFDRSHVFRRGRDYCARTFGEWYVLSARHGIVPPHQVIGPERPLQLLQAADRAAWCERVAAQVRARIDRSAEAPVFVLFASQWYADLLTRAVPGACFELPLEGMSLGERLRWYDARLVVRSRMLTRPLAPITSVGAAGLRRDDSAR